MVLTGSTNNLIPHWKTSDDNNQLRIEGTLLTDTSTIHCNVSNRHGSLLAGAYLRVYGKMFFLLANFFSLISIEMDSELLQNLFLICKVVDHLPNFNKQCLGYSSSTFQENGQHLMNTPYIFIIDFKLFYFFLSGYNNFDNILLFLQKGVKRRGMKSHSWLMMRSQEPQ